MSPQDPITDSADHWPELEDPGFGTGTVGDGETVGGTRDDRAPLDRRPVLSAEASADFVARTLREVMDERETVDREAAQVDEFQFPAGFLSRFELPPISADFVLRTVRKIERDRKGRSAPAPTGSAESAGTDPDRDLEQLLHSYGPESISDRFVERTLDALTLGALSPDALSPDALAPEALASEGEGTKSEPEGSTGPVDLDTLLASYGPATISSDFVERTLAAVERPRRPHALPRVSSSEARSEHRGPERRSPEHRWTARGAVLRLAAAALLTAGFVFFSWGPSDEPSNDQGSPGRVARVESGPNNSGGHSEAARDSRNDSLHIATNRLSRQLEPTRPATATASSVDPLLVLMRRAALAQGPQSGTSPETRRNR